MKRAVVLLFLTAVVVVQPRAIPQHIRTDLMPPLMRAADAGRIHEVRRLLQRGADVNEKLPDLNLTALMLAARHGHVAVVKMLLKAGADPNASGAVAHVGFYTPLILAITGRNKNRLAVIDTLMAAGARLNPTEPLADSPLQVAISEKDIGMVRALLKRGSDVNWQDEFGNTALATAVTTGERSVAIVRLLLKTGADPNTPRLWAGDDCVSILTFLDNEHKVSRDRVTSEIRRLIIEAGGKRNARKSHGEGCKPWTK